MKKPSLGVWLILTQRLGSRFRDVLDGADPDERVRVGSLFADAPDDLIRGLCGKELAGLLGQVTEKRNRWKGHGGATTDRVLEERNAWLVGQIEALRSLFGGAWADVPLVRAGQAEFDGAVLNYEVERIMGLSIPFDTQNVAVGTPMTSGQLYLVTDGARRELRIEPFVQLRASPDTAQFTCYFYNRFEHNAAMLVSYHIGQDADVSEQSPSDLSTLVAGFDAKSYSP
jgi:type I restriction enzyme M protein